MRIAPRALRPQDIFCGGRSFVVPRIAEKPIDVDFGLGLTQSLHDFGRTMVHAPSNVRRDRYTVGHALENDLVVCRRLGIGRRIVI
jgi:hypothetical protein